MLSYFRRYRDVIDKDPPCVLRRHLIHQPMIKRAYYAECTLLCQLLKLLNILKTDPTDTILGKIAETSHSYVQLSYYIKKSFLHAYDPICRTENCLYVSCKIYVCVA